MTLRLQLDCTGAHARGLRTDDEQLAPLAAWATQEESAGRLDFLGLPLDPAPAEAVRAWSDAAPAADDVLLVGIGGSALAARVFEALRPMGVVGPRLHVLDTVDPEPIQRLMRSIDPTRVCLVAISKSGGTLETGAVFRVLEEWLRGALGAGAEERIAIVCGEEPNPLRAHAEARGYMTFSIPAGVGGRYSALTPVGLLPAALVGVDPVALLAGAAAARTSCLEADPSTNPALALASMHFAAEQAGRKVCVLWPYGERLGPLGPWWAQLVGESLGKPGAEGPVGVTPVAARGPADQHSLLQLMVEGPDDKLTVFVDAAPAGVAPAGSSPAGAPRTEAGLVVPLGLGEAAGHTLGQIMRAEEAATVFALEEAGRPWARIRLAGADADAVGAFLLTYEMAVVYWGRLLGVDPFGQPGVQLGKSAALARLTGEPAALAERVAHFDLGGGP